MCVHVLRERERAPVLIQQGAVLHGSLKLKATDKAAVFDELEVRMRRSRCVSVVSTKVEALRGGFARLRDRVILQFQLSHKRKQCPPRRYTSIQTLTKQY